MMPLFGSHKNKDTAAMGRDERALNNEYGRTGGFDTTASGPGTTGAGTGGAYSTGVPGDGYNSQGYNNQGYDNQGYNNQPGIGHEYGAGRQGQYDSGVGSRRDNQYAMSTEDYNRNTQAGIPPSHVLNSTNERHGVGHSTTGKIEKTVGTMLGSNSLRAKGPQKEQEANALKVQSAELSEAERLEREAQLRRERAVAHGAHPDNRHLGGNPNTFN